jgi:hypothetical protein
VQLPAREKTMSTDWAKVLEYLEPKKSPFCPEEPSMPQKVFLRTNAIEALFGGAAGGALASLKATAAANGLNFDTQFGANAQDWLARILQGEDPNTFKNIIRQTAKLGLPDKVASLLDLGVDLDTIYSPYKNVMASVLEVNPQTIGLDDKTLRSAIGPDKEMSIYDWERSLRKDPRWQYTNNARSETSDAVMKVLQDFGFRG